MDIRIEKIKNYPLHQHLGVQEIYSEDGRGELRAIVNANVINPSGIYHGGVVYALADVCAFCGLLSKLSDDLAAVTHDIHVSILRPAMANDEVVYKSLVKKLGKSLCFIDVEASVNDKVIATARVTKSIVPAAMKENPGTNEGVS